MFVILCIEHNLFGYTQTVTNGLKKDVTVRIKYTFGHKVQHSGIKPGKTEKFTTKGWYAGVCIRTILVFVPEVKDFRVARFAKYDKKRKKYFRLYGGDFITCADHKWEIKKGAIHIPGDVRSGIQLWKPNTYIAVLK
ncbi:MAG: hypothetical protein WDZ41_05490 [Candidatus Babeliales bacterium]